MTSSAVNSAPSWNCTPLRRMEGVGLAVLGDLPAMRQVGDDGLAAVARIAPDQVVEHAALAAQAVDRAGLMHVEMRRPRGDAVAQHAARFRVRLRRRELEFRAVEFVRARPRPRARCHAQGRTRPPWRRPTLDEVAAVLRGNAWTRGLASRFLPFGLFHDRALCALMAGLLPPKAKTNTTKLRESLLESTRSGAACRRTNRPQMPAPTILEIEDLQTHFFTAVGTVRAVDGVSYALQQRRDAGRRRANPAAARA